MRKIILTLLLLVYSVFSLDKYTIPYAASDTMTKANFNSNHDTAKAYIDKIIDTINLNIPRYTANSYTHNDTMEFLIIDTLNTDTVTARMIDADSASIDTLTVQNIVGKPVIDSLVWVDVPCSLFTASALLATDTARILVIGHQKTIFFPEITGTLVGAEYHTIRIPSAYMPTVEGITFAIPIINNSTAEIGRLKLYDSGGPSGFNLLTSAEASLSSGTGGIDNGTSVTYY